MAKLAEIIGLSFTDMVDITVWALHLSVFGVFFGKLLYDLFNWFADLMSSMIHLSFNFIREHFSKRPEKEEQNAKYM